MIGAKGITIRRDSKTEDKSHDIKERKSIRKEPVLIYPMMPRRYTAFQREQLRKFERELLAGEKSRVK